MGKVVEGIFTLKNIEEGIDLVKKDNYVTSDVSSSFEVINKTQNIDNFDQFVENGIKLHNKMQFRELTDKEIKEYIKREEIMMKKMNENKQKHNILNFDNYNLFKENALIYGQRYDYNIDLPKSNIFIMRTPTLKDFIGIGV